MSNMLNSRSNVSQLVLLACCSLLLFCGCSFPRVIVLEDPLTAGEHLNLGTAYENKGEFDNAIKQYTLAAKKLPIAYLYLGNLHFQKKELNKAEESYKQAIRKEACNADAYNNLAWLYYIKRTNLNEAESLALRALEFNPSKKDIYTDTLDKIRALKKALR